MSLDTLANVIVILIEVFLFIIYWGFWIFVLCKFSEFNRKRKICVNNFLIINKRKKSLHQSIEINTFKELSKKVNFENNRPSKDIRESLNQSSRELKGFLINNCPYDLIYTTTNIVMERKLIDLEREKIIKLEKVEDSTKIRTQVLPKIFLMGIKTNIRNILNEKYWEYIFRKEKVSKYKIYINRNYTNKEEKCTLSE